MYNITDIKLLGTTFTITTSDGIPLRTIQVISAIEILDAALGEFNDSFTGYDDYLEQSVECLSGFAVSPYRILWWNCDQAARFATSDIELDIPRAFEYAIKYGYDVIILEDPLPLDDI